MHNETAQLNTDSYLAHILLCKERKIHSDSMTIHLISIIDILWLSRQSAITKKMAACTFSQDALPMSIENYGINMTQDHLMRNFRGTDKSTSCLTSIFQKTSIRFLKGFGPCNALVEKCTAAIFSVIVN